jgi:hypothetical protein
MGWGTNPKEHSMESGDPIAALHVTARANQL